uniref:Uncharacterized protein n=1 Tax=Hucho hucho TaxID=62062 RepID=A0A4W5QU16_9TELE
TSSGNIEMQLYKSKLIKRKSKGVKGLKSSDSLFDLQADQLFGVHLNNVSGLSQFIIQHEMKFSTVDVDKAINLSRVAWTILDFPYQLHFSLCPVKCSSQKTLLVRNIAPFSVESMQVTVDFLPKTEGDHSEDLLGTRESHEKISIANQISVSIVNSSDTIVHYQWKRFPNEHEEEQQKLRFCSELQREEEDEMDQFLTECDADPTPHDRLSLLSRTFQDRCRQLKEERLSVSDNYIIVEPLEGDIWPNTTSDVNIISQPQEAKIYQQMVYFDITVFSLWFDFTIHAVSSQVLLLSNKGLIESVAGPKGPFNLVPPSSAFGQCFSFSPTKRMVPPQSINQITLGVFSEEFLFTMYSVFPGTCIYCRGCIMGPTFHFNVSELNFEDVSFGEFFIHHQCCLLLTARRLIVDLPASPNWPTVFTLTPTSGTCQHPGVTLCSNSVQCYSLALVVDVQEVGEEVLALPINANYSDVCQNMRNPPNQSSHENVCSLRTI